MPDQLKDKLFNHEVPPPPGCWKDIAGELAESNELIPLSKKMYDYEVAPPAGSWRAIVDSLENISEGTPGIPVRNMPKRMNQVMAAAAVLGIVLMGSLYMFYNNSSRRQLSDVQKNLVKGDKKSKVSDRLPSPSTNIPEVALTEDRPNLAVSAIASNYITRKEKKNYLAENKKSLRNTIVNIAHSFLPEPKISIAARPIRNEKGDIIQDLKLVVNQGSGKYINVTGPNGQQTRISAKFMNLLLYLNGDSDIEEFEGYFDKHFLESLIWKSRFEDWRKKILETTFTPSSTNFMDILEFKDLITMDKDAP